MIIFKNINTLTNSYLKFKKEYSSKYFIQFIKLIAFMLSARSITKCIHFFLNAARKHYIKQ